MDSTDWSGDETENWRTAAFRPQRLRRDLGYRMDPNCTANHRVAAKLPRSAVT